MTIYITKHAATGQIWQIDDHDPPAADGSVKYHYKQIKYLFTVKAGDWFPTMVEAGIDAKKRIAAKVEKMQARLDKLKKKRVKTRVC
jgi:hypothetical protein